MKMTFPLRRRLFSWSKISLQIMVPLLLCQQANASVDHAAHAGTFAADSKLVHAYTLQSGEAVASMLKKYKLSTEQVWDINSFAFESKKAMLDAPAGTLFYLPGPGVIAPASSSSIATHQTAKHLLVPNGQVDDRKPVSSDQAAAGFASSLAGQAASQQAESWLNQFGGSSRITLGAGLGSSKSEIAGDVLIPLFDNKKENLFFTQIGLRRIDSRQTVNLGLGSRYFADEWMLGSNLFFDNDMTGKNRRWGLGAEWWTDNLRISANGYLRITDWHASRDGADLEERPANGWDAEIQGWLPAYPQIGGKLKYEQYYGQNVALISGNSMQSNPSAVSASVNWTPIPLVTLEGEHRSILGGKDDNVVRLMLNYDFSRSLAAGLDPSQVASSRSLQGGRYDLVSRNNRIVLEYRKQSLVSMSMTQKIEGKGGETVPLGIKVSTVHGFSKMRLVAPEFIAAKGEIIDGETEKASVVLPPYSSTTDNTYSLTATAIDAHGGESAPMHATIVVHEDIDKTKSTAVASLPLLPANGSSTSELTVTLVDKNSNPVKGVADKLSLKIKANARADAIVTFTEFTESSKPGTYTATITAGKSAGDVILLTTLRGETLFETPIKLEAVISEAVDVVALESDLNSAEVGKVITLTATVKDGQNKPVKDAVVTFGGVGLEGIGESKTDADGKAVATVTSPTAGTIMATAAVGAGTVMSKELQFTDTVGVIATISLETDKNGANAGETVIASATAKDAKGNPVPGKRITFEGNGLSISPATETNEQGVAISNISSEKAGEFTLTAASGNISVSKALSFIEAPSVGSVSLDADNKTPVVGDIITFTSVVKDKTGKVMPNQEVTFYSYKKFLLIKQLKVMTDKQGIAKTTGEALSIHKGVMVVASVNGEAGDITVPIG